MFSLHDEAVGTVVEVNNWGYSIRLPNGQAGFIDKTKAPGWDDGESLLMVGNRILVVIIDDGRSPCRLSTLPLDIELARRARSG